MKKVKQNGFVLIIVIGAMTLIVIEMSILTHISNLILIQSQCLKLYQSHLKIAVFCRRALYRVISLSYP